MKVTLKRVALKKLYTIGHIYIDGKYVCDTIEDTVRDLNKNGVFDNGEKKIPGETAIPYGKYEVTLHVKSPKFSNFAKYPWAKKYDGYLPRVLNVSSFEGILFHPGKDQNSSAGCIIVGMNKKVGQVVDSVMTFNKLMDNYFVPAKKRGEKIQLDII